MAEYNEHVLFNQLHFYDKHKLAHLAALSGIFFGQISFLSLCHLLANSCAFNFFVFIFVYILIVLLALYFFRRFLEYNRLSNSVKDRLIEIGCWFIGEHEISRTDRYLETMTGQFRIFIRDYKCSLILYALISFLIFLYATGMLRGC